jgi:hypothetical protein
MMFVLLFFTAYYDARADDSQTKDGDRDDGRD